MTRRGNTPTCASTVTADFRALRILAPRSGRETPMNIASPPSGAVVAMPTPSPKLDPLWDRLREQAEAMVRAAPELGGLVITSILSAPSFEAAVARRIAARLANLEISAHLLGDAFAEAFQADASIGRAIRADALAVLDRDPAATRLIEPVLYFKGFHTIQIHRLAHWLWRRNRAGFRALPAEPLLGSVPDRYPPGRAVRRRHLSRSCDRPRDRRDRGGGGRRLHSADGDARRHRQGKRRPPPENPPRRADRRRARKSSAISRSATAPALPRAPSCCSRSRPTPRSPACRRGWSARRAVPSPRARWISCSARKRTTRSIT